MHFELGSAAVIELPHWPDVLCATIGRHCTAYSSLLFLSAAVCCMTVGTLSQGIVTSGLSSCGVLLLQQQHALCAAFGVPGALVFQHRQKGRGRVCGAVALRPQEGATRGA